MTSSTITKNRILFILAISVISIVLCMLYIKDFTLLFPKNRTHGDRILNAKLGYKFYDLYHTSKYILVLLHIQKTGGTTFEKKLLNGMINLECQCGDKRKVCDCLRTDGSPWIIFRYNNFRGGGHFWPCGLHPDLTVLKECAPRLMEQKFGPKHNQEFVYITVLRDPIVRYISELRHVQRGATWKAANLTCKSKSNARKFSPCYENENWAGVPLKDFLSCEENLANNRQVRMLADLSKVDCDNFFAMSKEKRDQFLYKSAVDNLKAMPYFVLMEQPSESQFLFEKTFKLKFIKDWGLYDTGYAKEYLKNLSRSDILEVKRVNYLDMKLYEFAKKLFRTRLNAVKALLDEEPRQTRIIKNKKSKDILKQNWKRESQKARWKSKRGRKKKKKRPKT
eukprot:Seg888.13 transcript_id=Seg888.13/GoldUCD/mRNA.D3Y31 product="Heparan-sulfate 6-O-sulfotransferase 3" protein_id=Seg888.13/GoldUCD/D3Y31